MTTTMIEHPGWQQQAVGYARLVRTADGLWLAATGPDGITLECVAGYDDTKPTTTTADPADLPVPVPAQLRAALAARGPVQRLRNPWLWDAVTTAVLRQVVRADQARRLYRAWCAQHGDTAAQAPAGTATAPAPAAILELSDAAFADAGTKFHRSALRAAAAAYMEHAHEWQSLPAADLARALQTIPRIGPWTAHAAAADYTGDFSIYPHGDLAVRTWASTAAPDFEWPDTDRAFEKAWTTQAGNPTELHTLTMLTLAWGSHDHQHDRKDHP